MQVLLETAGSYTPGSYLHWGVVNVSWTNIAIIALMILVFFAAILIPFPHHDETGPDQEPRS